MKQSFLDFITTVVALSDSVKILLLSCLLVLAVYLFRKTDPGFRDPGASYCWHCGCKLEIQAEEQKGVLSSTCPECRVQYKRINLPRHYEGE